MTLSDHFLIQSLTEKNNELQTVNKLLFNKVLILKRKIKELECEFEDNIILEFDDFEIIDL
jgi:hypothetical protein